MKTIDRDKSVEIINMTNRSVSLEVPHLLIRRYFPRKGARVRMAFEELQQAFYEPGVEFLFREGILYIEDMEVKQALGLEPEGAETPQNIVILNDEEKHKALTEMSTPDFKKLFDSLTMEQKLDMADYAIYNKLTNYTKSEIIRKATQKDILAAIRLNEQDAEDV